MFTMIAMLSIHGDRIIFAKHVVTSGTIGSDLAIITLRGIIATQRGFLFFGIFKNTVKGCKIAFCRFAKDAYLCRRNGKAVY